jgi:hypothetical protein
VNEGSGSVQRQTDIVDSDEERAEMIGLRQLRIELGVERREHDEANIGIGIGDANPEEAAQHLHKTESVDTSPRWSRCDRCQHARVELDEMTSVAPLQSAVADQNGGFGRAANGRRPQQQARTGQRRLLPNRGTKIIEISDEHLARTKANRSWQ